MSKTRKQGKRPAAKPTPRPDPRPGRTPLISQSEARRRAERYVLNRMFKGAKVRDGAEVRLGIYLRKPWAPQDVWVVYKNLEGSLVLKSSEVLLVSKRTGRVLYEGPANDEG